MLSLSGTLSQKDKRNVTDYSSKHAPLIFSHTATSYTYHRVTAWNSEYSLWTSCIPVYAITEIFENLWQSLLTQSDKGVLMQFNSNNVHIC